jgi:hypothetical protein
MKHDPTFPRPREITIWAGGYPLAHVTVWIGARASAADRAALERVLESITWKAATQQP